MDKSMFFLSGNYIIKDLQSRDNAVGDKHQLGKMFRWYTEGYSVTSRR